ncbi:hypothetical protein [Photobacterium galatheae]|uniref:DUF4253 domain-containing protein n=1 Tax=Photobacterium galatheae TaxID=1654360 RepID=A0A066RT54_9GAMM|nr:hypothetical protein [Photobacterium galatheae]KDM93539.1 hypothetical protein EA58_00180 [Photobacterium galatheae]MCM0151363.1 hypothetical protein [Photobacterium galatheae]
MTLKKVPNDHRDAVTVCLTYVAENVTSFDDIFMYRQQLQETYKNHTILITLDDYHQARYTSMHRTNSSDLDDYEALAEQFDVHSDEDYENLSLDLKFKIREINFKKAFISEHSEFESYWLEYEKYPFFKQANLNPIEVLDKDIFFLIVPVDDTPLALTALPNGYFGCDMEPNDIYEMSEHLRKIYGFEFYGIGASLLCYQKTKPLNHTEANHLIDHFFTITSMEDDEIEYTEDPGIRKELQDMILNRDYLFLIYTE